MSAQYSVTVPDVPLSICLVEQGDWWNERLYFLLTTTQMPLYLRHIWATVPWQHISLPPALRMQTSHGLTVSFVSQAINPCFKNICHPHASCSYLGPNRHSCSCQKGYHGDGQVCLPVDPCQTNFGNCPTKSTMCKYDGPGQVSQEHMELMCPEIGKGALVTQTTGHLCLQAFMFWSPMLNLVFLARQSSLCSGPDHRATGFP